MSKLLLLAFPFLFYSCEKVTVEASFEMDYEYLYPPAYVSFTNTSTDAESYKWDFGDGSTSTEKDPTHFFMEAKDYNITLTAYGEKGESQITKSVELESSGLVFYIKNDASFALEACESWEVYSSGRIFEQRKHGKVKTGEFTSACPSGNSMIMVVFKAYGYYWIPVNYTTLKKSGITAISIDNQTNCYRYFTYPITYTKSMIPVLDNTNDICSLSEMLELVN